MHPIPRSYLALLLMATRHNPQIDVRAELHILHVDAEDRLASTNVRTIDENLAVETTGPQ